MDAIERELMQHIGPDFHRMFGNGPTFYPLSPAPLAPVASPEGAPAVVFSEDAP